MINIDYQDEIAKRLGSLTPNGNTGIVGGMGTEGYRVDKTAPAMPRILTDDERTQKQQTVANAATASDPRSFIQGVLGQYTYSPQSLAHGAEKQFTDAGYRLQKDSAGNFRGRVYDPTGRQWDFFDEAEGRTAQDNWNTNLRGKEWNVRDMGMPTSGGSQPSSGMNFQSGIADLLTGDPMSRIQAALGQYAGQSDFLQSLLAQLGQ